MLRASIDSEPRGTDNDGFWGIRGAIGRVEPTVRAIDGFEGGFGEPKALINDPDDLNVILGGLKA